MFAATSLSACGYGPVERYVAVERVASDSMRTAAVRWFAAGRLPTGLRTFPSGGFPLTLGEGMELYVCEGSTGEFRRLGVINKPKLESGDYSVRIVGWDDEGYVVGLGGYTVPPRNSLMGFLWLRVADDGSIDTLSSPPFPQQVLNAEPLPECAAALQALRKSRATPLGRAIE